MGIILNGCSVSNTMDSINPWSSSDEKPTSVALNPHSTTTDKYVRKSDSQTQMKRIKDIIYYKQGKDTRGYNGLQPITRNNIVHSEIEDNDMLPVILRKNKINYLDINNKKLGGIIKLIMTQLDNIGIIYEPNVNLNKKINMTIKNKNIYKALKDIVEYSGYALRYSAKKKSLIISEYVSKKYYIPASIFIDRNAKVSFNSKNISPEFKSSLNQSVKDIFLKNIKNIGSAEKLVTLDEQDGIVYVKERALYIKEIDNYITDFVQNRTQQFNVELAVIELAANKSNQFGVDLQNIISSAGKFSINSLSGGIPVLSKSINAKTGKIAYSATADSSVIQGTASLGKKLSFNWLLGALDKRGYSNVITKPNLLIQNHSIGYISLLDTINYPSGWNSSISGTTSTIMSKTVKIGQVENGMEFLVKVDEFPNKDFIQVSAVPSVKVANLGPDYATPDGNIKIPTVKTISTFSVANIKSGDLIVLSGFKKKTSNNNLNSPLLSKIPAVGQVFNQESSQNNYEEIAFLIKVTKITNSKETFRNTSNKAKQTYRQFR